MPYVHAYLTVRLIFAVGATFLMVVQVDDESPLDRWAIGLVGASVLLVWPLWLTALAVNQRNRP